MRIPDVLRTRLASRILLAAGLLILILAGLGGGLSPLRVQAARVDRGPISTEIQGIGTLESVQEVPLAFKVPGRILELPFDEGAPIRKGQVLGRLDPSDLGEQLAAARASRAAAGAGIDRADAELEHAKATEAKARADQGRAARLYDEGILSRADLDAARERLQVAAATTRAAEAAALQARRGESQARSAEALQRISFDEALLRSPVDGFLTRRLREPGHLVAAGTPVLTVVSTRKLWVRAWVDETSLGRLALGQAAEVELRSEPGRAYAGRVDRIGRQADRQTHELLVDVEVLELPRAFAVGQRAEVRIRPQGGPEVLRVPRDFLAAEGGVWVAREGRAHRLEPRLGFSGGAFVEVREGLAEGDRLIRPRKAGDRLREGMRVRPEAAS